MLELVHFLPSFALLGSVIVVFISMLLNLPLFKLAMLFILPLSFVSCIGRYQKKDLRIFPLIVSNTYPNIWIWFRLYQSLYFKSY